MKPLVSMALTAVLVAKLTTAHAADQLAGSPTKNTVPEHGQIQTGQIVVGSGPVQRTIFINKATGEANIL